MFQISTPRSIKNVEPVLLPVPLHKGLRIALIVETSNAESPHAECYSNTHTDTPMAVKPYAYIYNMGCL